MLTTMQQRLAAPASAAQEVRSSLRCNARLGSVAYTSSFKGGRPQKLNRPYGVKHVQQHRQLQVVQAGLGDVGKYLSEAATAVFSPAKETVPWSGGTNFAPCRLLLVSSMSSSCDLHATGTFSGKVSHHEGDVPRLKRLYKAVRETREQLAGCMDPNVSVS